MLPGSSRFQHCDNVPCEAVFDLPVPWDGLGNLRYAILIPVVTPTVPNEDTAHFFEQSKQIDSLHATRISPILRTHGIAPLVNS
jgi:hypothetical protein